MNIIDAIRIWKCWEKLKKITKKGDAMLNWKTTTLGILTIVAGLANAGINYLNGKDVNIPILLAAITAGWGLIHSTDSTTSAVNTAAIAKNTKNIAKVSGIVLLALMIGFAAVPSAQAQVAPVSSPSVGISNLYGLGVSYNNGGSPSIAATALYAHAANTVGTYAFGVMDVIPTSYKPFTVTTSVGAGVAQKVATIGSVPIFIPAATGITFTGTNTSWTWNTGAIAVVQIKPSIYALPMVRIAKITVGNNTAYQPIVGVLFGWGK